jgi:hypothetical protein
MGNAIDRFAVILRAPAHHQRERKAGHDGEHARAERRGAPAVGGQRPADHRHEEAAEREAERHGGERARPLALEPVDERHVQRKEPAQAGAERDQDKGGVELEQRLDPAEQHEAAAEEQHAQADHALRPEAVHYPAQQRPEDRRLHLLQRRRARERRLAPAAVVLQHRHVAAEGVVQQACLQELQAAARPDHLPAVEELAECGFCHAPP